MTLPAMDPAVVRAAGFTLLGEPLAIDLANTQKLARTPSLDLLAGPGAASFWALEAARLPNTGSGNGISPLPDHDEVRLLRAAIRSLLEARIDHLPLPAEAVEIVNAAAAGVAAPPQLVADEEGGARIEPDWSADAQADDAIILAAIARSAIDVITGGDATRLRRCASESCSMLFVAVNAKRQWCTAEGCGNRARVARHAARTARSR